MLTRAGLLKACLLGAALNASALFSSNGFAQYGCCEGGDATGANAWTEGNATSAQWPPNPPPPPAAIVTTLPVKAPPPVVAPVPYWWTHGELEFGGRGFVNNPDQSGSKYGNTARFNAITNPTGGYRYLGQNSLSKFYEYRIENPNPFGGGHVAAGTSDGLYQIDLWANNIASDFHGFSDQSYLLQASKAGEHYFWFNWDQTPHIYSTSALTPYLGVGSNNLTLPAGATAFVGGVTSVGNLLPFLHQTDIGIKRDTASAAYRWTPPDPSRPEGYAWDLRADYSHMDRTGTQVQGVAMNSPGGPAAQVPAPVDDTTQNFGASGEYAGISPWGGKYTVKLAYNGSVYTDNLSRYFVQNPFQNQLSTPPAAGISPVLAMSTPPSNDANGFSSVLAADLPARSRYVGTFNYTRMEQDDKFIPMSANPVSVASPFGVPWNQLNFGFLNGNLGNPTNSLHGEINTWLSNNVLTTRITPTLTSKLSYRYYNFDNETPRIVFPLWVANDRNTVQGCAVPAGTGNECSISSLTISYVKQNAGAELNWRPSPEWNFNLGGGWEHYDYTQTDADATNEFSGKASVDWKPTVWLTARASGYYADRRYDNYNYNQNVSAIQFPNFLPTFPRSTSSWYYSPAYRQFMYDNRERTKADFAIDLVAFRGVTISPTLKYQEDYFGLNPLNQNGISDQRMLSTGVDVGWVVDPNLSFVFTYYYETIGQWLYSTSGGGSGAVLPPPASAYGGQVLTTDKQHINTWTAGISWSAIPDKLNLDVRYALSDGVNEQQCSRCVTGGNPFPNDTTLWQRLDATATYKFDPIWVRQFFNGDLKAKLRYTWERNSVNNWQNDPLAPFTSFVATNFLWMAYNNPNYNVHMLAGSLIATW